MLGFFVIPLKYAVVMLVFEVGGKATKKPPQYLAKTCEDTKGASFSIKFPLFNLISDKKRISNRTLVDLYL
jgi:hypothetical protein